MVDAREDRVGAPLDGPRFWAFVETAPDAIVIADAQDRLTFLNPAAERLFGHRAADVVGQSVQILVPEAQRDAHHGAFVRFMQTGTGRLMGTTIEVTALRADGTEFPIELSLGSAGEGDQRTATAVIRDLSDRRRRGRHLAAQLAVTAVMASHSDPAETPSLILEGLTRALEWDVGALWMVGDDGRLALRHVWEADPEATRPFAAATRDPGYDPHAGLTGKTLRARVPEWYDDLARTPSFLRRDAALASGLRGAVSLPLLSEGRAFGVIECFTRESMPVDVELRDLLMTVAGQVGEHLQRLRAQEELARAKAELERSNRELQEFAHVAAHDLQSPLRTVSGFAELLLRRRGSLPAEQEAEFLRAIHDSAVSGSELLTNLLAYARLGGAALQLEEVETGALARQVAASLGEEATGRRAVVDVGELPPVRADRVQLAQLLQNLVGNAIKYTPADRVPTVRVTAETLGGEVRFAVADNGPGVPPEDREQLFEMFRRGADAEAGTEGTGIGLAVCARIVERHGGRLWVEDAPGGGSVFLFTLPR